MNNAAFLGPGMGKFNRPRVQAAGDGAEIASAFHRAHAGPGPVIEGLPRCGHGAIDVGRLALGHAQKGFLGMRRDYRKPGVSGRGDPAAADEQAVGMAKRK